MIEVRNIRHGKDNTVEQVPVDPRSTVYHADIVPGKSIRLHGVAYPGTRSERSFDLTFNIGDTATHGSYNLIYLGTITNITAKTVTIKPRHGDRVRRMSLYEFAWRHDNFSVEKAMKNNNEWMD